MILYKKNKINIGIVILKNPPVNALSASMLDRFYEIIDKIERDKKLRVLIIKSELKVFCAGADLKERQFMNKSETLETVDKIRELFYKIEKLPIPVISAINGSALGGGAELALACDFRIGSKNAKIGLTEAGLGIIPGAGGTHRLSKIIGPSKAKYWIFTAQIFSSDIALNDGYLDFVSDDEYGFSIDLATKIIDSAPLSIKYSKILINMGYNKKIADELSIEKKLYTKIVDSKDRNNGLESFIKKKKPDWDGI